MINVKKDDNTFDFLAEISNDVIEIVNADLIRTHVNPAIQEYSGVPEDIFKGKSILESHLFPDIGKLIAAVVSESIKQKSAVEKEVISTTLKGLTTFQVKAFPRIINDSIENIFIVYRDITELKIKDLELKNVNRKFITAAESLLQPFVILHPVFENQEIVDFIYDYINQEGCIINGIPKEETIGRRLLDLFPLHRELGTFDAFREVFNSGLPFRKTIKYNGPAGAGTLDGYFILSAAKIKDGLVVTWQDITSETTAQEEIRKSEQRFYSAFNANPVAMVLTNSSGKIITVNRRFKQLFGFTRQEAGGKSLRELTITMNDEALKDIEKSIAQKEVITRLNLEAKDKAGNTLRLLFSSVPMETTSTLNFLFTLVDMTKQKELERSLLSSLEEKDVLLKEIHHRVKNNLQIISSLLNLQSSATNSEEAQTIISETKNRIQSIALMHENLYRNKNLSSIKLDDYVIDMLKKIHQTYYVPEKLINWNVDIQDIYVDLKHCLSFGLIINELVTNCYKYAFNNMERGEIKINALKVKGNMELIISDNGRGLPEGTDLNQPGTLGLQLVSILTSQIDGKISYRNRGGAEFKITFPLIS